MDRRYIADVARRIKLDPKLRDTLKEGYSKVRELNMITDRGYKDYNDIFSSVLNEPITDWIRNLYIANKRPLNIIDLGSANGRFLHELKPELNSLGVQVNTTAISFGHNRELIKQREKSNIDRIIFGPAELFYPNDKHDVIFDNFGAISYMPKVMLEEFFFRTIGSLNPRGVLLINTFLKSTFKSVKGTTIHDIIDKHYEELVRMGFRVFASHNRSTYMIVFSHPPSAS